MGKIPLEEGKGKRKGRDLQSLPKFTFGTLPFFFSLGMVRLRTCCCHGDHRSLVSFLLFLFLSFFTFFYFLLEYRIYSLLAVAEKCLMVDRVWGGGEKRKEKERKA